MKTALRGLLVAVMLIIVGTVGTPAAKAADAGVEVVQIWSCEMEDGVTEVQVEGIASGWLKAIKAMPGGAAVKMRVFFPAVTSGTDAIDFYFVMTAPSFTDWGKIWDAYTDDSAAAKAEDLNQGKVNCANSMLWEAHDVVGN